MRKLRKNWMTELPIKIVKWIGSVSSLVLHTVLFIANFSLYFFGMPIDTVLLILTTVVSIEAIFLAIFMQISINQQSDKLDEVERLELQELKQKSRNVSAWKFWK